MAVLQILLGLIACALTSLALGISAIRLLRIELSRCEAICLGYVLGGALASTLTLALALTWVARRGVFLAIACGAVALLWRNAGWLRSLKPAPAAARIPTALIALSLAAFAIYGIFYFRQALSPEMSPDGTSYHLALVNLWNGAHGMAKNTRIYGALPDGMEMLFLFAFSIGRHSAAALVHFSFLLLLPVLMMLYGRRFGWERVGAIVAAALVFVSPLMGVDGSAAYNDVALATISFACIFLLAIWRENRHTGTLIACALLAGFAFAVKYTGGFLALFIAVVVAWEMRRTTRRRAAVILLAACAIMALPIAPYLIRNAVWFQNPIAFFGNSIFRNRWFHISFERYYVGGLARMHGLRWTEIPRELTFGGPKIAECFGPAFVLMPLGLAGLAWRRTRLLVIAAAFLACGFLGNKSARFLIPSAPLMAMAAGFVIAKLPRPALVAGVILAADMVISWPAVNDRLHLWSGWSLQDDVTWAVALRRVPEEEWLMRSEGYRVSRLIEEHVPPGEAVLLLSGPVAQSSTTRPVLADFESAYGERMKDLLIATWDSPVNSIPRWTVSFPRTRVREFDIVETGEGDMWSVNEIQLWEGSKLLQRSGGWRMNAFPNPWDAPLAFDGLLATRWRTWEAYRPGMWIRIRFEPAMSMDRVQAIVSEGAADKMRASICDEQGHWMHPAYTLDREPPADRRREATEELKRCGFTYIEIRRTDWANRAFRSDYAGWGVREIASTPNVLLLAVD